MTTGGKKALSSKLQAPEKFQAPNSKKASVRRLAFGAWNLVLLWCLVLGAWCFPSSAQNPPIRDPLMSLMISQPRIELGAPVTPGASFDPPVVRPGELSLYRVTFNALEESIEWPSQLNSQPRLDLRASGHAQVLQMLGPFMEPRTTFNYRVRSSNT